LRRTRHGGGGEGRRFCGAFRCAVRVLENSLL
jgi:hypothetical protein